MLAAEISDQLGNQMFAYASVKTIAERKGYDFGFVRKHNERINDSDPVYGNEIQTIFPRAKADYLPELPSDIKYTFEEQVTPYSTLFFASRALQVKDQTLMKGHYISYLYFKDNLEHVRDWFAFPDEVRERCTDKVRALRETYPGKELAAVHFRVGPDYSRQGFLLRSSYWFRAAEYIRKKYGKDRVVFVPFYDSRTGRHNAVRQFLRLFPCETIRGSLVEDMCCMTLFRNLIVCNSSFSIMAGILNPVPDHLILRPSVYPSGVHYQPNDCFPEEWVVIDARRSSRSHRQYLRMVQKGKLLKKIRKNSSGA